MKKNSRILIVRSEYNDTADMEIITNKTIDANKELKRTTIVVKGAFEIPVVISKLSKKYDGFIAVGCIVKGQTANFDLISAAITNGIMQISVAQKKPIGNSIITLFNKDQATQRFDSGKEAARAVLEVLKIK